MNEVFISTFNNHISNQSDGMLKFVQGFKMKKFFQKAKLEYKFKKAGEGHTLEGNSQASSSQQASTSQAPAARAVPSSDAQRAGLVSN